MSEDTKDGSENRQSPHSEEELISTEIRNPTIEFEDDFPEDNLEKEEIAKKLTSMCEFYPTTNLVEAYLISKTGGAKCETYQLLKLWGDILREINGQVECIQLSRQDRTCLNTISEDIENRRIDYDNGVGNTEPLTVDLPDKVIKRIPEVLAKLEERNIVLFTNKGCSLSTGYGSQMTSNKFVGIYQSYSTEKLYEHFGLRF